MSEFDAPPPSDALPIDAPPLSPIRLVGQYIRDLSFEAPGAPDIFNILRNQQPDITVSLDTAVRQLVGSPTFEVLVTIQLDAVAGGKKAFILELAYGCVVEINDQLIPQEHMHPVLMIEIPRQMFPFIRQIVADVTANGGFPPLMLQVFDFADIYRKKFGSLPDPNAAPDAPPAPAVH